MPYDGLLVKFEIKCCECKKPITRDHSNRKYCKSCAEIRTKILKKKWKREHYKRTYSTNVCVICTNLFNSKSSKKKYCSAGCEYKQRKITRHYKRIQFHQQQIRILGGLLQ
jgi:hypothetical protein